MKNRKRKRGIRTIDRQKCIFRMSSIVMEGYMDDLKLEPIKHLKEERKKRRNEEKEKTERKEEKREDEEDEKQG